MGRHSQSTFAAWMGIQTTTWNNYEKGINRISLDIARQVCAKTGATLDWIYEGNERFLPLHLARCLEDYRAQADHSKKRA